MLIDMHVHEKTFSSDSFMGIEEIIARSKVLGLDAVCITDHESNGLRERSEEISRNFRFPVFVGAEILTFDGDVLVFGLDRLPEQKMHASDLVELVKRNGGTAICAHPYRQNGRGMGDVLKQLSGLSGVEAWNGSTPYALNLKACQAAMQKNLCLFGSSDAHDLQQLGKYATEFQGNVRDERDLIEAIREGDVAPVYYAQGSYYRFDAEITESGFGTYGIS